jgi:hypothetical protein
MPGGMGNGERVAHRGIQIHCKLRPAIFAQVKNLPDSEASGNNLRLSFLAFIRPPFLPDSGPTAPALAVSIVPTRQHAGFPEE